MLSNRLAIEIDGENILFIAWQEIFERGHFRNKRIVVADLDEPHMRVRNVYEDIDDESAHNERKCVVTLFPERAIASSNGDDEAGIYVMTHKQAIADIFKMIRHGFKVTLVERERQESE